MSSFTVTSCRGYLRTQSSIHDGALPRNSKRLLAVNYFRKEAPPQTLNRVPNTPLSCDNGIKLIKFANAMKKIMRKSQQILKNTHEQTRYLIKFQIRSLHLF